MPRKRRKGGPRSSRLGKNSRKSRRTKTKQQKATRRSRRRRMSQQNTAAERIAQVAATAAAAATFAVGASAASPSGWNYRGGEWAGKGSIQDLKREFRRQSLITHPDKCPQSKKAQCNDEFAVMSNAYDAMMTALAVGDKEDAPGGGGGNPFSHWTPQQRAYEAHKQQMGREGLNILLPILAASFAALHLAPPILCPKRTRR